MPYDPDKHHRRSIRLPAWDYASAGMYHVTLCTYARACLFGQVYDGEVVLSDAGEVADACWRAIPAHFANVAVDAYVIMPNHVHGIIFITERPCPVGARYISPLPDDAVESGVSESSASARRFVAPERGSLGIIVGTFKAAVTRRYNWQEDTSGIPIWQRNYYETIIRNERHLEAIREYIANNPFNWPHDEYHPDNL
jgi:putative transposase